jgi:hypothetical protein
LVERGTAARVHDHRVAGRALCLGGGDRGWRDATGMQVEFKAYADDYTVGGATDLQGDRLADFIDSVHELEVQGVTVRALEDGRAYDLPSAVIPREELCVVAATGPRGRRDLRLRTRAYPMRAEVGPYAVVGYFHVPPTADPFAIVRKRRVVALRPVRICFDVAGERVEETHDTLLLMGAKIEVFEPSSDEVVGLARALEIAINLDRQAEGVAI